MTFGTHLAHEGNYCHLPPVYSIRSQAVTGARAALLEGKLLDFVKVDSRELRVSFTLNEFPHMTLSYTIGVGLRYFDVLKHSIHEQQSALDLITATAVDAYGINRLHIYATARPLPKRPISPVGASETSGPTNFHPMRGAQ